MISNALVLNTDTSILTSSSSGGSAVLMLAFYNSDTVARSITVNVCPANEATSIQNTLFTKSINPGETFVFSEKIILENTDVIKAVGSVTSVIAATVSYKDM